MTKRKARTSEVDTDKSSSLEDLAELAGPPAALLQPQRQTYLVQARRERV